MQSYKVLLNNPRTRHLFQLAINVNLRNLAGLGTSIKIRSCIANKNAVFIQSVALCIKFYLLLSQPDGYYDWMASNSQELEDGSLLFKTRDLKWGKQLHIKQSSQVVYFIYKRVRVKLRWKQIVLDYVRDDFIFIFCRFVLSSCQIALYVCRYTRGS